MPDYSFLSSSPDITPLGSGKVRELLSVGPDHLLLVATDRISALDYILPTPIPNKGAVLTAMTTFWLNTMADIIPNHLVSTDVAAFGFGLAEYASELQGRAMLCKRAEPILVECVARGYITGSAWKEYGETGQICGVQLPPGLQESERLPSPIFTPAYKAPQGDHDENITVEQLVALVGQDLADQLAEVTLALYTRAHDVCAEAGIILADTKFEFGMIDGTLHLIDEVCTPDSSRFWPKDSYRVGQSQPSYDKQPVRDWLATQTFTPADPPALPAALVEQTAQTYIQAYENITHLAFTDWITP